MKKFLNVFLWVVFFLLLAPSSMALASWNAVPGDATYSWKIALENALLLVLSPSDKLQTSTHVKLTERRFNEVQTVLSRENGQVTESLSNFTEQMKVTTTNISEIEKSENKVALTEQYIESLNEIVQELEEEQTVRSLNSNTTGLGTSPSGKNNSNQNSISTTPITPSPIVPAPTEEEIEEEIEETKEEIEEIIEELEELKEEGLSGMNSVDEEQDSSKGKSPNSDKRKDKKEKDDEKVERGRNNNSEDDKSDDRSDDDRSDDKSDDDRSDDKHR